MREKPPGTRRPARTVGATWLIVPVVCWLAGGTWARAAEPVMWLDIIDLYLASDYAATTSALESSLQRDLGPEVTAAMARLRRDVSASTPATPERRRALRRLKGAVLVPLESLLPLSARVADDPRFIPLENPCGVHASCPQWTWLASAGGPPSAAAWYRSRAPRLCGAVSQQT